MSIKELMIYLIVVLVICTIFLFCGCMQPHQTNESLLDTLIETSKALSAATTISTPVNPYSLPITVGLAGITAVLEALRRKEKAGRKHAETKLNGNNGSK